VIPGNVAGIIKITAGIDMQQTLRRSLPGSGELPSNYWIMEMPVVRRIGRAKTIVNDI
jgi:hypothetical protein